MTNNNYKEAKKKFYRKFTCDWPDPPGAVVVYPLSKEIIPAKHLWNFIVSLLDKQAKEYEVKVATDKCDYKRIPLSRFGTTVVDADKYDELVKYRWHVNVRKRDYMRYVVRHITRPNGSKETIYMHRLLLGLKLGDGKQVDHINGDTFDNRLSNLRLATPSQNQMNKRKKMTKASSWYKGVYWKKREERWRAVIVTGGKKKDLGLYDSQEDAARAYNEAALKLYGKFACINEVQPSPADWEEKIGDAFLVGYKACENQKGLVVASDELEKSIKALKDKE